MIFEITFAFHLTSLFSSAPLVKLNLETCLHSLVEGTLTLTSEILSFLIDWNTKYKDGFRNVGFMIAVQEADQQNVFILPHKIFSFSQLVSHTEAQGGIWGPMCKALLPKRPKNEQTGQTSPNKALGQVGRISSCTKIYFWRDSVLTAQYKLKLMYIVNELVRNLTLRSAIWLLLW